VHNDKRLLAELRHHRCFLAAAVGLGGIAGVALVVQALILAHLVDAVFLEGASRDALWTPLAALLGVMLARVALGWGSEAAGAQLARSVKTSLRERVTERTLARGGTLAARESSGEIAGALTDGIAALDAYFAHYVPQMALAVVVPLTVASFVIFRDVLSGVVLLLTAPLIPLFMVLIGRLAESISKRQWVEMQRLSAFFFDVLSALPTLRALGSARAQVERLEDVSERFRDATMRVLRVAFLSGLALELIATLSVAVVAVQIGLRLLYGHVPFEEALFVLLLAPEFYQPLRQLGARAHAGLSAVTAADRLYGLLESPVSDLGGRVPMPPRPTLSLEQAVVEYPGERGGVVRALDGVSLTLRPDERLALVGASGAGKTTIARLLLRFVDPTCGRLLADGLDASRIDARAWRRAFAFVPQTPHLFHDTIGANIRLARPDASHEEMVAAARAARVDDFVRTLPEGYDTLVGERGSRFSGGQAQRIALARAFLQDAPIVVLDESTAHLDVRLAAQLAETTERLLEGRCAIVIAHRLGTVRRADRIVVLEKGRVVEEGPHSTLAARSGPYRKLLRAREGHS
jgi:thiol reductant ABC exporter CydD subunit